MKKKRVRKKGLVISAVLLCLGTVGVVVIKNLTPGDIEAEIPDPHPPDPEVEALQREARAVAAELRKTLPESVDPLVVLGAVYNREGKLNDAARCWEAVLAQDPRRPDAYNCLGWVAMQNEDYEKAISLWKNALQLDPSFVGVNYRLALALMGLGRQEEAITALQREIALAPGNGTSHFLLGQQYLQLGKLNKAKACYERAVRAEPELTSAYYGLMSVCMRLKLRNEAKLHQATFKKLKTKDMQVLKERDKTFVDRKKVREGLACTCCEAGRVYAAHSMKEKAETLWRRAAALDPKNVECRRLLVGRCMLSNRQQEALSLCREMCRATPYDPTAHVSLGQVAMQLGRMAEAEGAFRKAIARAPGQAGGYTELARLYLTASRNLPEAENLAGKAVELEPTGETWFLLGWARDKNGNIDGALAALRSALELEPQN